MGEIMSISRTATRWLRALLAAAALSNLSCANGLWPLAGNGSSLMERWRSQTARAEAAAAAEEQKQPATVEQLIAQGDEFRDDGSLADALFSYARAHRTADEASVAGERIAFLQLRRDPGRAEAIFEVLLDNDPYSSTLRTGLALASLAQSDLERARLELDEAIRLDPGAATPRLVLGVILDRLDESEAAQEQYRAAHALRPQDWVILNNLGVSYLLSDDPESAEDSLRRAVHLRPDDPALRNNLGLAIGLQGRPEDAFRQFSRASNEAMAHNNLGWTYYLRGDYVRALEHFEQALDVEGDAVLTVLRNIELARAALGDAEAPEIGFEAVPVSTEEREELAGR